MDGSYQEIHFSQPDIVVYAVELPQVHGLEACIA
jgi:CheY-like chemotaxis protein